jgi:outer membrane protein assembly factor BamB
MNKPTLLLVLCTAPVVRAQSVTSVTPSEASRSQRIVIEGSGLGDAQGRVLVGGMPAPISYWTDGRIRAYVPEGTALGAQPVVVEPAGGVGTPPVPVTVAPRPGPQGRVKWRFQADDPYLFAQPAVAQDGTIYAVGVYGHLYALDPQGGLRWIYNGADGAAPVSVGPDGTVYVGSDVQAIDPATGERRWRFVLPNSAGRRVGPNVGPDGNIYGVTDSDCVSGAWGAFVVSPQGQLLHHDPRGYEYRHGPYPYEVAFGGDQWHITSGHGGPTCGIYGLYALGLGSEGGGFRWSAGGNGQVRADLASGNVYVQDPSGNRVVSYSAQGSERWFISLNTLGGQPGLWPALGADRTFYVTIQGRSLKAIDDSGQVRWTVSKPLDLPQVRPDNRLVVGYWYSGSLTIPPTFEARSTVNGSLLWDVAMPKENAYWVAAYTVPEFAPDGRTVYFGTAAWNSPTDQWSYLYAMDATLPDDPPPCGSADFNGDGDAGTDGDIEAFFACLAGACCPGCGSSDFDGDGDFATDADIEAFFRVLAGGTC